MGKKVHLIKTGGGIACGTKGQRVVTEGEVNCKNCLSKVGREFKTAAWQGDLEAIGRISGQKIHSVTYCEAYIRAAEQGNLDVLKFLQDKYDIDKDTVTKAAVSVTEKNGGYNSYKISDPERDVLQYLLDQGADPTKPLAPAADNGDEKTVNLLLDHGADPSGGLEKAAGNSQYKIVKLLLDRGADVNHNDTLLAAVKDLREDRWYNDPDDSQPLQLVRLLLDNGANISDDAFCFVVDRGNEEIFRRMLDQGVNVNAVSKTRGYRESSAVCLAMERENIGMVVTLLKRGADPLTLPKATRQLFSTLTLEQFAEIKDILSVNEVMSA